MGGTSVRVMFICCNIVDFDIGNGGYSSFWIVVNCAGDGNDCLLQEVVIGGSQDVFG